MSTTSTASRKIEKTSVTKWVPISLMRVSPLAQRKLRQARVDKIAADFDPEQIGVPTVNKRGGYYYLIDGQHRIAALEVIGWGDQQLQCQVYEGLSEKEEAQMFLRLNDILPVNAFEKFRIGIQAGNAEQVAIDKIVRERGCVITTEKGDGTIRSVGALSRIYENGGAEVLGRTLDIITAAYGSSGLQTAVLDGIGLVVMRYNQSLEDDKVVTRLGAMRGGVNGLLGNAQVIRRQTRVALSHSVAAAVVDAVNGQRGGKKLTPWFRD